MINRRGLLTGLISLAVTAPAIIRPGVLMPIRVIRPTLHRTNYKIIGMVWNGGVYRRGILPDLVHAAGDTDFGQFSFTLKVTPISGIIKLGDTLSVDDDGRAYA